MYDVTDCQSFKEMYAKVKKDIKNQKNIDLLVSKFDVNSLKLAVKEKKIYKNIQFNFYVDNEKTPLTFEKYFIPENKDNFFQYQNFIFADPDEVEVFGVLKNPFLNKNAFFEFEGSELISLDLDEEDAKNILVNSNFFEDEFTDERLEKLSVVFDSLKDDGYEFDIDYISLLRDKNSLSLLKKLNDDFVQMELLNTISKIFILIEAHYIEMFGEN